MEQQPPTTAAAAAAATGTGTAPLPPLPPPTSAESLPPPQRQPQPQPQQQPQPSSNSLPPPAPAATSSASTESIPASQNPNPTPKPSIPPATPLQQSAPAPSSQPQASQPLPSPAQPKPPVLTRPWQQPPSSLTHFSSSSSPAAPAAAGPPQRGGIAIGVPAHHTSPPAQAAPFSSPLGQHFGGLGRGSVNVPDSIPNASASQVRPATPTGMGSIGSGSQMRPGGIHQQRPLQSSVRPPPSPANQPPPSSQSVQGHGLLRGSAVGSPISHSSSTSQGMQSPNQPWLSSPSQGKPPLPSPSYRPQMNPQSLQQRTLMSQQHHPPLSTAPQQQYTTPGPSQPAQSNQSQEQHGQQFPPSRAPQSLPHQQISRIQGSGAHKPSSLTTMQAQPITAPMSGKIAGSGSDEFCNRILSKRSIHELVNQIDPSEKLDPEVEDILVDIAEEFVESITAFGCSLAKHRKSTSLEAKDILLHLERNWNIALPGFSADEVKSYRKPVTNDIHKERLAVIKKSAAVSEVVNARNAPGQVASSAKGTLAKAAANVLGSPNLKS